MHPRKTALALAALQSHDAPLDMRQRRVLILADGQRSIEELATLGGRGADAIVQGLLEQGYLDDGRSVAAATVAASAPPPPPADPRRALLNARMYLLDLLQLQRHPASPALQLQLRAAREEQDTLRAIALALRTMPEMTSERYAQRIRERVLEILPASLHGALAVAAEAA